MGFIHGVGPINAAMIIAQTSDIARFPSCGHYASDNATAPIEASSGPQSAASAQPARQPPPELGDPHHRRHPAPLRHRRPPLLRPQSRRRQDDQRSAASTEAPNLRRRLPTPRRRRPPTRTTAVGAGTHIDDGGRLLDPRWNRQSREARFAHNVRHAWASSSSA